jgi:hypothetical protein
MSQEKMIRQVYKLDKNHHDIKKSLYDEGFLVTDLASLGYGISDLDVVFTNRHGIKFDFYIEVKSGTKLSLRSFTASQIREFKQSMRPVLVLNNVDQPTHLVRYLNGCRKCRDVNKFLEESIYYYDKIVNLSKEIKDE